MTEVQPFGREILGGTPDEIVAAESRNGRGSAFAALDDVVWQLVARSFAGERLVEITRGRTGDVVSVRGLSASARRIIDADFALSSQQARGAWFLPEEASLRVGVANLAAHLQNQVDFASNAAKDEGAKVRLDRSSDAFFCWALLIPLFSELLAPIELRTATGKLQPPETQRIAWARVESFYRGIGVEVGGQLRAMRYGGGWGRLRIREQLAVKRELLSALAQQIDLDTVRRHRAWQVGQLVNAFYAKAKRGSALARQVLTKQHQPTLAAYFGGDWLALLRYLGEEPHPSEEVTTALAETRLVVGGSTRAAAIAAERGLPVADVEAMLASYLGQPSVASPVEERVSVMQRWWSAFDELHAAQAPGMPSLWGLVEDGVSWLDDGSGPYRSGLYDELLPADLNGDIERLWDGMTIARWPERIVSEPWPHRAMADAFGPAVSLWHGIALTAWFICEGPSSRTDLSGLEDYHGKHLDSLDEAGFAVDRAVFAELRAAERRLGPPEAITERIDHGDAGGAGISFAIEMSRGSRRDGFTILREIVTKHRRAWTAKNLDNYLKARWDGELRSVGREFNRRLAAKGRAPTIKQFASFASQPANHWFGGDLGALYAALGERAPARPQRIDLLPGSPRDFAWSVYSAIGGLGPLPQEEAMRNPQLRNSQWHLRRLGAESLRYLQLHEALGRPPSLNEFGETKFNWPGPGSIDEGWALYEAAIADARRAPQKSRAVRPPLGPSDPRAVLVEAARADLAVPPAKPARRGWLARLLGR